MKRILLIALAACGAFLSSPVSAQQPQFLFIVPVEVRNLPPNLTLMYVNCSLFYGAPLLRAMPYRRGSYSFGSTTVRIPQVPAAADGTVGEFIGDVAVEHEVMPGFDPALATHFSCTMNFFDSATSVNYFDVTRPDESPRFPVADGAPFRIETGIQPIRR